MSSRWRPYLLGILGLAAITFPFLWLQLAPDFTNNTVTSRGRRRTGCNFSAIFSRSSSSPC
jgi:hypothetical protein